MTPEEIKHEEVTTTKVQLTDLEKERSRRLIPIAIGLGLLLIVGGIAFLNSTRNRKVANLPEYTPGIVTPLTTTPSPSPVSSPSSTSVAGVEVPTASSAPQVAGSQTAKPNTSSKTKAKSSPLPQYTPQSQLPNYQPNSSGESLPAYTPSSSLPEYQPQYSGPTNETKQTIRVTLAIPGNSNGYSVEVQQGATVLDVLKTAQAKGFITYKSQYYSSYNSEMVTEINGRAQTNNQYWTYAINGKFASKGISLQTVNDGDDISWTFSG